MQTAAVHRANTRNRSAPATVLQFGARIGIDTEFLNLARNRVAPKAQQLGSLDSPVACCMHRPADQHALELSQQALVDFAGRFRE